MFKKIFKKIRKVIKPLGKAFKKVMKPFAKIQQKLGPVGTMALMFIAPYALPAIWGAFGAWAGVSAGAAAGGAASFQALAPGIQTLMKGIYAAGTKIGAAYNTVTGFISDTVGKIASNTVGKIPLGAEKTVGSVWKNFTNNLSMTMEARNLGYGNNIVSADGTLSKGFTEAKKLTAQNFEIASKVGERQIERSLAFGDALPQLGELPKVVQPTMSAGNLNIPTTESLLGDSIFSEPTQKVIVDLNHSFKKANISGNQLATSKKRLGVESLDFLEPVTADVPVSLIQDNPQLIYNNNRLIDYTNDVNKFATPYIGEDALPFDRSKLTRKKLISDTRKGLEGIETLTGAATEPETDDIYQAQQNMQLAQSLAPIGYSGLQDFSSDFSNLSNTYSAAGYGPETNFTTGQSQYEAGAYGGAGFMNQVSSRFLQPTIGMPRLA